MWPIELSFGTQSPPTAYLRCPHGIRSRFHVTVERLSVRPSVCLSYRSSNGGLRVCCCGQVIYFASAAVAVDSSHTTASSSASWSRFSPRSNFVDRHASTMWFTVCRWPQSQEGDWARPHLCKWCRSTAVGAVQQAPELSSKCGQRHMRPDGGGSTDLFRVVLEGNSEISKTRLLPSL